jgi:hypothetical protein
VSDFDLSNSSFDLEWWIEGTRYARVKSPESGDGFAYFCEACEAVWAAKYFPNRAVTKFYGACARHPSSRGEVPGSLVLWWHDELERMPAALVEREYLIHLTHYERECHERDTLERQAA